jgi:uncharacterized membrane protein
MRHLLALLRDRLIAGFFFIIPFLVLLLIAREVLSFVGKLLGPFAQRLPTAGLTGPIADYFVAATALLAAALLAGIVAQLPLVRKLGEKVELFALRRIPGFTLLKGFLQTSDTSESVKVLLVTLDDAWLFGFLMETMPDGTLAVFIPGVPSPTSGSLYFFAEHQVRRTDIKVRDAMACLSRLGVGSSRLVSGRLPAD